MNVGDKITIEIFSEICCDYCNEIIHNHMDCPICNKSYASTDAYCEICESGEIVTCENCSSEFQYNGLDENCEYVFTITKIGK